jgi:mannose-1-phosphate guanylyltransferase
MSGGKLKRTVLIMAGGRGERFWPRSRKSMPKQFLSLTNDGKTMIQLTVERLLPMIEEEDIFISTNADYKKLVQEQLPDIPERNILCEPIGRNTAPCIGLGAVHIAKKYGDAIMMVLPSDHQIKFTGMFLSTLKDICSVAEQGPNLVTIGITPDYPETGYGYIKFNPNSVNEHAYQVERFVEKPNLEVAKEYVASEEYLWNSGMFAWKVSTILGNMKKYMPENFERLLTIQKAIGTQEEEFVLNKEFHNMDSQSIDYGIMEKADNIYIVPGTFGWDDVGSWLAVERIQKTNELGNVVTGDVISVDTSNCIIQGNKKMIATIGLTDMVIVDTDDAILICQKDHAGDIKKVIENLKICNRNDLL